MDPLSSVVTVLMLLLWMCVLSRSSLLVEVVELREGVFHGNRGAGSSSRPLFSKKNISRH